MGEGLGDLADDLSPYEEEGGGRMGGRVLDH